MSEIRSIWVYANNVIHSSRKLINYKMKPMGLSSAEGNILLHLLTQGDTLYQDKLVEELDISKPAVSRALYSLEKKGYIKRKKDEKDRRLSLVFLTHKTREAGPAIEGIYNEVVSIAKEGLTRDEILDFIQVFQKVSNNFSTHLKGKKTGGERKNGTG